MKRILVFRHYAAYHWPRAYRYRVGDPGLRLHWNDYGGRSSVHQRGDDHEIHEGRARIGIALVAGRYAYCVKWATAKIQITREAP